MPLDEDLLYRMREVMRKNAFPFKEKKMFGGIAFMYRGKMCCGITNKGMMMTRVPKERYEELLQHEHASEMNFTGKPMKGFLFVDGDGSATESGIADWLELGMEYVDGEVD